MLILISGLINDVVYDPLKAFVPYPVDTLLEVDEVVVVGPALIGCIGVFQFVSSLKSTCSPVSTSSTFCLSLGYNYGAVVLARTVIQVILLW